MSEIVKHSNKQGKEKMKPLAGDGCNKHRSGAETRDLTYEVLENKSLNNRRSVAFHYIIVAVSNACVLHSTLESNLLKHV
jgi:hypothetical protein